MRIRPELVKMPRHSHNAYFEVNYVPSTRKWIIILVDRDGRVRKPLATLRWWWQCQLYLWCAPELPLLKIGANAVNKRTYGNVDSGMR